MTNVAGHMPRRCARDRLREAARALAVAASMLLAVASATAGAEETSRLIVKYRDGAAKSLRPAAQAVAETAERLGAPLRLLRTMSVGAHVLALDRPVPLGEAQALAARIAADGDVLYAEPDRLRFAQRVPNDPAPSTQSYYGNGPTGIGLYDAWDITTGSPAVVVAVLDTGYRPHGDLAGRIIAGYDMVSSPPIANDGDGRDADPSDPGDFVTSADRTGDLADCAITNSTWHGTAVAGIIGANADNGIWSAGVDWNAKLQPVRVLGKCGGYDSDIVDGIAWAGGLTVAGVPANATPAQVINMSLGGTQVCPAYYRDTIAAVLAHGVTRAIVVAAGNDNADVAQHTPASCPGVIAVASANSNGDRAVYSDFGAGITLTAPGGQYSATGASSSIRVLSNTGATIPRNDTLSSGGGTSYAAPMVSGTIALMLAVAPGLTATEVRQLLIGTVKPFVVGSTCNTALCGPGLLDTHAAVAAAAAGGPGVVATVVEYYNASLDHYFITWSASEQANLDAGNTPTRWTRTGYGFRTYTTAQASSSPVCRYYIPPGLGDSHFFGRGTVECTSTGLRNPSFVLEDPAIMHMVLPVAGICPAGTAPVYRVFSNRPDANHRYMTDRAVRDQMVTRGWLAEGDGPDLVVMCSPA